MRALLLDLWRHHGFGVLLVTHDVDEAIELADRVLVLEDGRIAHSIEIEAPRPTASERTAQHDQYRADLLDKLGVRL
jgi:sulfonate transport system ATP-binding protein